MSYNLVQTFFLPANAVNGAAQVLLSSVQLYFKQKPNREGNRSGFTNPSVSVQICPADRDQPYVQSMESQPRSRMTWDEITASTDAGTATTFEFVSPVPLLTNAYYGIYIQVSDDDYVLWGSTQGHRLVNTNTPASGPSGRYDGFLFEGSSDTSFRASSGRDLKFGVNLARFSANTASTVTLVAEDYEFLTINSVIGDFYTKEKVFQDASAKSLTVPVYADLPGKLSINALSTRVMGNGTNFSTIANGTFIVLSTDDSANTYSVGQVDTVSNSTLMFLKNPVPLTSNGFNGNYRISPVADVFEAKPYYDKTNEIVLYRSNANTTNHFVSGGLKGITVSNTGAGYSNTNVVRAVNQNGGTDAVFSITTNNSGSISYLTVITPGAGFTSPTSNVRIEVSSVDTTLKSGNPGANAVITVAANQIGLSLVGTTSGAAANLVSVDNKVLSEIWPVFQEVSTLDGSIDVRHAFSNGTALGVTSNALYRDTKLGVLNQLRDYPSTLASKSNEMAANSGASSKMSVVLRVDRPNDFLFETPMIDADRVSIVTYENAINNDASNEHTNFGNATAKYIGKRIAFDRSTTSEDLMVYVKASRPSGTNVKVYAKFHNSVDDEPFDDKAWTELIRTTPDVFTSPKDPDDTTVMTFTIPQYPAIELELDGVVSTSNGSTTVTGVGTSFSNTLVDRLIRIYSPLQPTNHQVVSVTAVANSTSLTTGSPIVNNSVQESVVGNGLKMQLLKYNGTAFNNILNDNVARYHTMSNLAEIDGFDTFAIKVVLLSDNKYIVPTVEDVSMVGVSA